MRIIDTISFFFFFNDTATTEIYTLSLHDALPISPLRRRLPGHEGHAGRGRPGRGRPRRAAADALRAPQPVGARSEEHTSELQSPCNLVCRLLLAKKKTSDCARTRLRCSPTPRVSA